MKKTIQYPTRWIFSILLPLLLFSCNNGGKERERQWVSSTEIEEPLTAEELRVTLDGFLDQNNLFYQHEVVSFYEGRGNLPAWNETETRDQFFRELLNAGEEGLSFQDYHGSELKRLMENTEHLSDEELLSLEVFLTDAFFRFSNHLLNGKLDPKSLYPKWGVKREEEPLGEILERAVQKREVDKAIAELKPPHQVYAGLKRSLKEYKELRENEEPFEKISGGKAIKPGKEDGRIPNIVARLKQLDLLDPAQTISGNRYDAETEAAIREFQRQKKLSVDGIIGNTTLKELNKDNEGRYRQILANLERWRWYPRDLGDHYILVNIPNYNLVVVKNGDTVRTHNVIAGTRARQTPIFSDTLQYIVINPQWTIPPTIKNQDIIPKAAKNPSYLRNNNIIVSDRNGERLDPESIDWTSEEVRKYNYTQRSGASNPLGRVKIIYPNRYLVYLHDTPAKGLFDLNERAESSGCVRVENAVDLSSYLVDDLEDWTLEKIQDVINSGRTKQVKINRPIQVHHFYWTAWRDGDETVFRDDVYGLDEKVYEALMD